MYADPKVIILLGPPGSGKGTQAARLSSALGVPAISTGEMLRREARSGSPLGEAVHQAMTSGGLVSDDLINRVVAARLRLKDCERGCILDGYPRTVGQARYLQKLLSRMRIGSPVIFDFDIPAESIVLRLSRRRQCAECGRIFSVNGTWNDGDGFCSHDGSRLVCRADDHPETVRERLSVYRKNASELIFHYRAGDYHRVSADRAAEAISDELLAVLASAWRAPALGASSEPRETGYRA